MCPFTNLGTGWHMERVAPRRAGQSTDLWAPGWPRSARSALRLRGLEEPVPGHVATPSGTDRPPPTGCEEATAAPTDQGELTDSAPAQCHPRALNPTPNKAREPSDDFLSLL